MKEDRNIVKNSTNTIIGNHNIQNIRITKKIENEKPFDLPIDDNLNRFVNFGRWFWNRFGKKNFYLFTIIPLIIYFVFFIGIIIYIFYFNNGIQNGFDINELDFFLKLIIVLVFGGLIITPLVTLLYLSRTRTCQNCERHFAYKEYKPRKHLSRNEYRGKIYHNINQFLRCDYCGYIFVHPFTDIEEIKPQDD